MTFFKQTRIAYWQTIERQSLRSSFEKSIKRNTITVLDRNRIRPARRNDLLAVNSYSRLKWNEAVCTQIANFFCDGGDGIRHRREIMFVTLCDERCMRSPHDKLSHENLGWIKSRLRYGLRGLSYLAVIEPAFYVNFQAGIHYGKGKRCISWHLHALVWAISEKEMRKRLRGCRKKGWYVKLGTGLKPTQVKSIKQGRLPRTVGYLLKSPVSAYRVSRVDRVRKGQPVVDADGVVQWKYKQGKSPLRHGERLTLYHAMRHLHLDELALAGGEGRPLLAEAKRLMRPLPAEDRPASANPNMPGYARRPPGKTPWRRSNQSRK